MSKEETNRLLKLKGIINENDDEYVERFRKTYKNIIGNLDEKDFYDSMVAWFFDGSTGARYYDYWLKKNWSN